MSSFIHPYHRPDPHNQLLFWMCGFAWVVLSAMTSGVIVAEDVAPRRIHLRKLASTMCLMRISVKGGAVFELLAAKGTDVSQNMSLGSNSL